MRPENIHSLTFWVLYKIDGKKLCSLKQFVRVNSGYITQLTAKIKTVILLSST